MSGPLLRWSAASDRGRVRLNNEDAFLGLWFDAKEAHYLGKVGEASLEHADYVFAVSDGMGGAMAGEFASRIALEKIAGLLPRAYHQAALGWAAGLPDVLSELFDRIDRALRFVGGSYEETSGMGATLTLAVVTPDWLYFGHVGDSRLYYLAAGSTALRQLSHDDTHVGWLHRQGLLNEREARTHPRRHLLQKALGGGNQFIDPQTGAVAYEAGDLFLLCSDGLVDGLYDATIVEILRAPEPDLAGLPPAQRLVQASLSHSGQDNLTAVVIEL